MVHRTQITVILILLLLGLAPAGPAEANVRRPVIVPDESGNVIEVKANTGAPNTVYFYLNDHLSTPRIVTDDTGQGVWRARYAPFGQVIEHCYDPVNETWDAPCPLSQPIRFPGQWDDGIEGVWYNWHRFYLPEYGLYGRVDPVFQVGAQVWDYVGGNPVSGIDPEGLLDIYYVSPDNPKSTAGHVSMRLEDGTYISLQPRETILIPFELWSSKEGRLATSDAELYDIYGYADRVYHIDGLDEERIRNWYQLNKGKKLPYTAATDNCTHLITRLLKLAGMDFGKFKKKKKLAPLTTPPYFREIVDQSVLLANPATPEGLSKLLDALDYEGHVEENVHFTRQ